MHATIEMARLSYRFYVLDKLKRLNKLNGSQLPGQYIGFIDLNMKLLLMVPPPTELFRTTAAMKALAEILGLTPHEESEIEWDALAELNRPTTQT